MNDYVKEIPVIIEKMYYTLTKKQKQLVDSWVEYYAPLVTKDEKICNHFICGGLCAFIEYFEGSTSQSMDKFKKHQQKIH